MSADVQRLLDAFIADDRGAEPADPQRYLVKVDGIDRTELTALIDAYLARAPRRPVSGRASNATTRAVAEQVERGLFGASGAWPALLPRLRARARVVRRDLVAALAQRLGVADETERVAGYYHRMEQGLLPAAGVSDRVLEALGALLGESAQRLRAAGEAIAPLADPVDGPAHARTATPDDELAARTAAREQDPGERAPHDRNLVDELFTGGPGAGIGA